MGDARARLLWASKKREEKKKNWKQINEIFTSCVNVLITCSLSPVTLFTQCRVWRGCLRCKVSSEIRSSPPSRLHFLQSKINDFLALRSAETNCENAEIYFSPYFSSHRDSCACDNFSRLLPSVDDDDFAFESVVLEFIKCWPRWWYSSGTKVDGRTRRRYFRQFFHLSK